MTYLTSILDTIKKMLGLAADYDAFDTDVIVGINSALMILNQLGVGPENAYAITGRDSTWEDFLGDSETDVESVKMFVYLTTRSTFDPPASSSVANAMEEMRKELEWRLAVKVYE